MRLTSSKSKQRINYIGVVRTFNNYYEARLTFKGRMYKFGPYRTEIEAARKYDHEALKRNPQRNHINFPTQRMQMKTTAQRIKMLRSKFDKNYGKNGLTKKQIDRSKYMREKFPVATRNFVCAKQKWKCNFCKETLSDIFIIDHMVPLFLGGTNENHNLQSLCPSCDRYKTSYLDHRVIKPLSEKKTLGYEDIIKIQEEEYCKKNCVSFQEATTKKRSAPTKEKATNTATETDAETDADEVEEPQKKRTRRSGPPASVPSGPPASVSSDTPSGAPGFMKASEPVFTNSLPGTVLSISVKTKSGETKAIHIKVPSEQDDDLLVRVKHNQVTLNWTK